jgi:hypothetical protein
VSALDFKRDPRETPVGQLASTVRVGRLILTRGDTLYLKHAGTYVAEARVERLYWGPLDRVPHWAYQMEHNPASRTLDGLKANLAKHYPGIAGWDEVTVILYERTA